MFFHEVIIAGAGIIGLSCGRELAQKGFSVLILERLKKAGQVTSSRNSQVIHAGMYYSTDSLKATLCVEGNRLLKQYCMERGVKTLITGKFIVANSELEEGKLGKIFSQGTINGVAGLQLVTGTYVRQVEPSIRAASAIYSPNTAVVDTHQLVQSIRDDFLQAGGSIAYGHEVTHIERLQSGYRVKGIAGENFEADCQYFINTSGLQADLICKASGFDIDGLGYRMKFVKGNYFRIKNPERFGIKHLIYPVPPDDLNGLGVHLTLDIDGSLRLGPNVEELPNRTENYAVEEAWRDSFANSARSYLPNLRNEDLIPDTSGIRPRLIPPVSTSTDFIIKEESEHGFPNWINLIGIESPGLTCCLSISKYVLSRFF